MKNLRLTQTLTILLALSAFLLPYSVPAFAFDAPDVGEGKCYGNCGGGGGGSSWGGGNWGGGQVYYVPTGPSPQELEQQRKRRASNKSNNKGVEYHNRGDYQQAIRFYRDALRINPGNATARENLRRAEQELEWQKQRSVTVANNRGVEYHNRGDYETAIKLYKEALRIAPYDSVTRENLRVAKQELEWQKQTQASIEANNKGVEQANNGDYETAIKFYKEALRIAPYDVIAEENLRSAEQALKWKQNFAKSLEFTSGTEPSTSRAKRDAVSKGLSFIDPAVSQTKKNTLQISEVPVPHIPSPSEMNDHYVDTDSTTWPQVEAAVVMVRDLKNTAKVELAHFLRVEGLSQIYQATVGKYKVVQISKALVENYEATRKGQIGLRKKLLDQGFEKINAVLVIGSQAKDDIVVESEWKDIITTGEKTLDQTTEAIKESISRSSQGWWGNRVPNAVSEEGGKIRPLQFNRQEGLEYKRLKPYLRLDEKWSKYLSHVR